MKLLLLSILVSLQTLIAKALENDLQFQYANTITFEQPEGTDEIQILKYKLENVYYIIYDELYANSTIYQKGLVREYKDKYCSNGNSCRFFSKPLKNAAVDNSQIIKFFEYLGTDLIKFLGNVGRVTSGCAFKNAKYLNENDTPDVIPIDGFFYTDINSKLVNAYKDQSIYFNGINEETPLAKFEWIKFISVFYGMEKEATRIFNDISFQYVCNRDLIANNNLFARLRIAWLTSKAPDTIKWITSDYEYVKTLLIDAGATLTNPKEVNSYEEVKDILQKSHFLIDISSNSSGDYKMTDFYDQYRYDVDADLPLLKEQNILRNDAIRSEEGLRTWEDDYMAFPHLVLLDLIYWFHPKLFLENEYNTNIVKKLYGMSTEDNLITNNIMNGNDTVIENDTTDESNNNSSDINDNLTKRSHSSSHSNSSYWFRNIPRNTQFKIEPKDRCPSLLFEYIGNNVCLSDVNFKGDYEDYAMFDDVITQVKNYAIIYYPIIGIITVCSLVLAYIFLRCFKKHQLEKKGYHDNHKKSNDTEGFVEI